MTAGAEARAPMAPETKAFFDGIHIWANEDGEVTVECNYCSEGDYVFWDSTSMPDGLIWAPAALTHFTARHLDEIERGD